MVIPSDARVVVTADSTTFVEGGGSAEDVTKITETVVIGIWDQQGIDLEGALVDADVAPGVTP